MTDRTTAGGAGLRSRMANLSIRTKILSIGLIGIIGALILGGVNIWALNNSNAAAEEIVASKNVSIAATELLWDVAEANSYQNSYAFDVNRLGAKAVDPTSANRATFLKRVEETNKSLENFPQCLCLIPAAESLEAASAMVVRRRPSGVSSA